MSTKSVALPDAPIKESAPAGVDRIGLVAGEVWHLLHEAGSQSPTQLADRIKAPRDLVMQAVGWLAREGKLQIQEQGRRKTVALNP